jgi:thiamine biosynthesis lipoprotein
MPGAPVFQHTFAAMNTRFTMVLPSVAADVGERLASEVEAFVGRQERLMSRFVEDGAVARINRYAGQAAVAAGDAWDVLLACRGHWRRTDGAFDIAQGARTSGASSASADNGMQYVELDDAARTVRFAAPGVKLDLGGVGKGIALDNVVLRLRARGVERAFLSFGESSIAVIGSHPAGDYWPVGVADPARDDTALHSFRLRDGAMSTSGNRGDDGHTVDPRSGLRRDGRCVLSVACASAVDAEVLSTALLVTSCAERARILNNYPGAEGVEFVGSTNAGPQGLHKSWHDAS